MKWNLSVFYQNDAQWQKDYDLLKGHIASLGTFKGKLNNYDDFLAYHMANEELTLLFYKVYPYASLGSDLNLKDPNKNNLRQQVYYLFSLVNQTTAYASPEIISIGQKKVMGFCQKDPLLKTYQFVYEKLFRSQEHILDEKGETILANFANASNIVTSLHQSLAIVDRTNETVVLSDGTNVEVSSANYAQLMENSLCDADRQLIFNALYKRYADNKSAFAATYELALKKLESNYKSRGFNSALEAKLYGDNIPVSVFKTLTETTYENTHLLKRYFELRRQILGLKKHNFYDRLLPLAKTDKKYTYEESYKLFVDSIKGMDKEFVDAQLQSLADGYVDVLPGDGKRTGAYSMGLYGSNPFILLNHNDTLDALFTLAHEAGHSAHTLLSNQNQPLAVADYTIFVAEIASTFNEHILLDHLLKKCESKSEKIVLLQQAIDAICATFYRQTLFATYEDRANELLASGQPINEQSLSQIFIDLYQHYYDIDITKEGQLRLEWAHVPHFFNSPFYVYQYATSFAASLKIYDNIKSGKKGAFNDFIGLLKSGGSDYPVNQAKKAGADLTNKETILAVFKRFEQLLDLLEETIK